MAPVGAEAATLAAVATSPEPRRLRVGLFCDSRLQPRWVVEAFAKVAQSDFAEIALIAAGDAVPREPLLWKAYNGLDRMAFARGEDPGERIEIAAAFPHRKFFILEKNHRPSTLDLDVAFAVGAIDDRELDGVARHGVWRFSFTGGEALAGYGEVARGEPLTGSALTVRLSAGAPARLAYQSWSRTYPLSAARNREQLLAKTAEFALRALRELHRSGPAWLDKCKLANRGQSPIPGGGGEPGNRALTPILRIGGRIVQRSVEKALNVEQWFLAYRFTDGRARSSRFGDPRAIAPDLRGYVRLMPPKDRYWADPFALEKNGRYFVFFEELPFKAGRAHISMIEIDRASGRASAPVRVLERDYHLSYPFLVEHEGQLYMIPETAQRGTVEAWRCIDFPLRWKLERVLMSGTRCVDATFHRAADRWWMFANAAASGSRMFDDELHLFHSDRLLGDWQPHPANPVKSDARCARPAGQLYWKDGALYRPAQICAPLYGSGLSINRVLRLTRREYVERQVERILPSGADGLLGVHTVNRAGDLTVIDGFARRPRF